MTKANLKLIPRPKIISTNSMGSIQELIISVGHILLDLGRPGSEVADLIARAREAALIDEGFAIAILRESGIRITFHNHDITY